MLVGLLPAAAVATLTLHVVTSADGSDGLASVPLSSPSEANSANSDLTLRIGDQVVTATLDDTTAAAEFAGMLPLRTTLHDPMGTAKSGRLPQPITVRDAQRVVDLEVGTIYYWPPSGDIGIVYEDIAAAVPPPGAVPLGSIDSGLDVVASAGNRFDVSINLR
jgi:hypothetical protein